MIPQAGARAAATSTSCTAFAAFAMLLLPGPAQAQDQSGLRRYVVVRNSIPLALTGVAGDPVAGRKVVTSRELGNCTLCHALPDADTSQVAGNIGPPLAGVGARLGAAQLRMRLVDSTRLNPQSVMPAYYRVDRLNQVAAAYRGKPVLTAQQVEDAIAYLRGLH
jgi:L-cysteine S-thiosulfotransferase